MGRFTTSAFKQRRAPSSRLGWVVRCLPPCPPPLPPLPWDPPLWLEEGEEWKEEDGGMEE
jgi:hypothetical protein